MKDNQLLQHIGLSLGRIFTTHDFIQVGMQMGLTKDYLSVKLSKMAKNGSLRKLFRGHYALPNALLSGPPLHEFEMIQAIAKPAVLCCWSAMAVHQLTDQFSKKFYILTNADHPSSKYIYTIEKKEFILIRTQNALFFGYEKQFIHDISFNITDLERTLLDGLTKPQYCGGFFEVMHAFERARDRLNTDKIKDYAARFGKGTQKRLGWVFETLNIYPEIVHDLKAIPSSSAYCLDLTQNNQGEWLPDWNLIRNF